MINFKVEYDEAPILSAAVQCPNCGKWFRADDISEEDDRIRCNTDLIYADFTCPICGKYFSVANEHNNYCKEDYNIKECDNASEVYDNCLLKKVRWE